MKHPDKWRNTIDPHQLPLRDFSILKILGYPHAGNDVFHVHGLYQKKEVEAYIKVARQHGADLKNEVHTIHQLGWELTPEIIEWDKEQGQFSVSLAKPGERLSTIVGNNSAHQSLRYLYEYGQTLAMLHNQTGDFANCKDRKFFHIPEPEYFSNPELRFVYDYLMSHQPQTLDRCFCHGDFHYANILWENNHISAILDFELSGWGSREFDIAWAIILRPGQKFLNTPEEITLFLNGYRSVSNYRWDWVKYYMVLIYSYFYRIGSDDPAYQVYIRTVFEDYCRE